MSHYRIETSPNEDREGVQVWIYRDDGEFTSLAVAEDWGEFDNGDRIPDSVIQRARRLADSVNY